MLKFTVLMPVYNRAEFVATAIKSILTQTLRDFKFLIYDDGSTDESISIIKKLQQTDNRIIFMQGGINKGGLYSRQLLLDNCPTEIGVWQDSDDFSMPRRLEEQYKLIDAGLVYCDWTWLTFTNKWKISSTETVRKNIIASMFKIDPEIRMDTTRIWGSLAWFNEMELKYPKYARAKGNLYCTRRHPGRITEIKLKLDRLMRAGLVKEEDFIHLSYPELIKFVNPLFERYKL